MRVELVVIDGQNDFSDHPDAALPVPGTLEDAARLAKFIDQLGDRLDDIHCTLDTHQKLHIANPIFWVNSKGEHPKPKALTVIDIEAVEKGVWRATNPQFHPRARDYVAALAANKRYTLTIWNPHCLVGRWGHNVIPVLADAYDRWEDQFARVDYVAKGHNMWTEHYSAVQADVPDPNDPTTQLNTPFIATIEKPDIILLAGWAENFCLANTVRDIANNFGPESVRKMVLLTDATSPITGAPFLDQMTQEFLAEMKTRGMQTATTKNFSC